MAEFEVVNPDELEKLKLAMSEKKSVPEKTGKLSEYSEGDDLIEIKELPSSFKVYDTKVLHVRGLTVGEVKSLNRVSSDRDLKSIIKIYDRVIDDVKVIEMLPVDFKFAMFYVAVLTDPDFHLEVKLTCPEPNCEKGFVANILADSIDYQTLDVPSITIGPFELKPFRMRDIMFLDTIKDLNDSKDTIDQYDIDLAAITIMSDQSISSSNSQKKFDDQYAKVSKLPNKKYAALIRDAIKKLVLDINDTKVECTHCKHKFSVPVNIEFTRVYL